MGRELSSNEPMWSPMCPFRLLRKVKLKWTGFTDPSDQGSLSLGHDLVRRVTLLGSKKQSLPNVTGEGGSCGEANNGAWNYTSS